MRRKLSVLKSVREKKLVSVRDKTIKDFSKNEMKILLNKMKLFEKKYDFKTKDSSFFYEFYKNLSLLKRKQSDVIVNKLVLFIKNITNLRFIENNHKDFHKIFLKLHFSFNPINEHTSLSLTSFFQKYFENKKISTKDLKLTGLIYLKSFLLNETRAEVFKKYLDFMYHSENKNSKTLLKIYKDLDRIKSGLVSRDLYSAFEQKHCPVTYGGFLRVLSEKTPFFIRINNKDYIAKSIPGKKFPYTGYNELLLDPKTLDVYSYRYSISKKKYILGRNLISFDDANKGSVLSSEIKSYLESLKENYIKYYENRHFSSEEKKKRAIKRVIDIFNKRKPDFLVD